MSAGREEFSMEISFGISPISWTNDDLPELGADTSLETCLSEIKLAGYSGTELGGKFPRDKFELQQVLRTHGLRLVSGWHSGRLLGDSLKTEIERIKPHLDLMAALGAPVLVYGETFNTVQNQRFVPLSARPMLESSEFKAYGERLTELAIFCAGQGVEISFHHHMGTGVESETELDLVMQYTGQEVGLLVDTGHLLFAGGDVLGVINRHGHRINHVHAKDIRKNILERVDRTTDSFLDCVLDGVFTVPGDGMIDFSSVIKSLADQNYSGWIVVEAEQDPQKADPYQYACLGLDTLTKAALEAGFNIVH
jgi:inosose dehydratase